MNYSRARIVRFIFISLRENCYADPNSPKLLPFSFYLNFNAFYYIILCVCVRVYEFYLYIAF